MSDPLERPGDRMFTAAAEYGRTHLGWPNPDVVAPDPVDDLLERAENANSPELGLAYAQMATARAIQQQTEQARISNLLALAAAESHVALDLDDLRAGTSDRVWKALGLS